jgi:hypothetical protein
MFTAKTWAVIFPLKQDSTVINIVPISAGGAAVLRVKVGVSTLLGKDWPPT